MTDPVKEKKETLGEVLNGDRLVSAPYKIDFLVDKYSQVACRKMLTKEEVSRFRNAVVKDYFIQMYFDDLPIKAFIGKTDHGGVVEQIQYKYLLFKHLHFHIFFNKDRVIEVAVRTDPQFFVDISEDKEVDVEFMYTVNWKEIQIPFEKRMERYSLSSTLPRHLEIHWFAIMNSCVTIVLLVGCFVTFYIRVLKKDIMKYAQDEELSDNQEETGWKYIHGDVFRMVFVLILGLAGIFYPYNRGRLLTALVVIYAITSVIAGYTAVSFYCQLEGPNWVYNLGIYFYNGLCVLMRSLGFWVDRVTAALPLGTIALIFLIWIFFASPLLLLGGIAGKNSKSEFHAPCRTSKCPREIPTLRWYRGLLPQMALAGVLPFGVIYLEIYYIFASIWGHRVYSTYGILCIVFVLLLVVTAFVALALTYFLLAAEDHEWWWRSFLCGGSTGLFIYGYCFYYYFTRTDMNGLLQSSFFFGYMACICYGIFLMLGTVGFRASLVFIRYIYGSIKCE
ncbi:unnamed protein product [Ilex paraguariensis]|uniref:Transmembrane 9 superfamily member n=1 Tax=Ilex paraguariensis TaxID=185542 RepID=A0ABC8R5H0_9AQUA